MLRSGCWSARLRSSGSISWSSSKVDSRSRKVKPTPLLADTGTDLVCVAADKDELLEMIAHGAEKIVNSNEEWVLFSCWSVGSTDGVSVS